MVFRFPFVISGITALLAGVIYVLHLLGLVTPANEVYMRYFALGMFIAGFVFLGWREMKNYRFSWDDIYKNNTLIVVAFSILLASMFLHVRVGYITVGIFVFVSFLHFLYTRKLYRPPVFFYFVILYALLLLFGTIGTEQGFRFPSKILSFYLLPLSLCFFCLSPKNMYRIGALFFRVGIIFLVLCLLYWWFNFLFLDVNLNDWVGEKTGYNVQMTDWESQRKIMGRFSVEPVVNENINYFPARFFVTSWSYFYHPSTISLVLFFGLLTGFYLYHKRTVLPTITKWELILYVLLAFGVIIMMQSRIGLVGFLLIIFATGLYYLKLKTNYFIIGLIISVLLGGIAFIGLKDKISGFVDDEVRTSYRRIAVSYIQDNFWWGGGYGQQQVLLQKEAEKIKDSLPEVVYPHTQFRISYVHNQFLGNMVQYGIGGLLVLLMMISSIAYYAVKNRSYLLQMATIVLILFMMIEEPLYVLDTIIPVLTFLIFFAAVAESEKRPICHE